MVYPVLLPLMRTPRLPVVDWIDAPADLNGLVRFAERRNLVSARVPSHFNWPLPHVALYSLSCSLSFLFLAPQPPSGPGPPHSRGFLDHTQRRATVGRTPLDEWSACHRDLYLTTHNIHNRQTSMTPVGFEPTNSADERPQTYALDRAATGTGVLSVHFKTNWLLWLKWLVYRNARKDVSKS